MLGSETQTIKCPFCDKGSVKVIYKPPIKMEKIARGSAINKRTTVYTKEHYTVLEDCPHCGASKKKIEKALNSGEDYNRPSHKDILERMKKAGLPTRV